MKYVNDDDDNSMTLMLYQTIRVRCWWCLYWCGTCHTNVNIDYNNNWIEKKNSVAIASHRRPPPCFAIMGYLARFSNRHLLFLFSWWWIAFDRFLIIFSCRWIACLCMCVSGCYEEREKSTTIKNICERDGKRKHNNKEKFRIHSYQ